MLELMEKVLFFLEISGFGDVLECGGYFKVF